MFCVTTAMKHMSPHLLSQPPTPAQHKTARVYYTFPQHNHGAFSYIGLFPETHILLLSQVAQMIHPAGWDRKALSEKDVGKICYKSRSDWSSDGAVRSCHSFAPPSINHLHYSSGIIAIVITTEYCHSIGVTQFPCKCIVSSGALIFDTFPFYLGISVTRGYKLFPWHHFRK